jgi:hypothetical protein
VRVAEPLGGIFEAIFFILKLLFYKTTGIGQMTSDMIEA